MPRKQSDATKLKHLKRRFRTVQKERDEWKLSAETWKKSFNDLVAQLERRMK